MTRYWCANFDGDEETLKYGLDENLWAMQYQYSHGGHTYQSNRDQLPSTTRNWREAARVEVSDWLVAYLAPSRFFAIGEVIEPRKRVRHQKQRVHTDFIKRTTWEHSHRFLDGVVRYTSETSCFYEDFTDEWFSLHGKEKWKYAQRIDVRKWENIRPSGISLPGLLDAARSCKSMMRVSVFRISKSFFEQIKKRLETGDC